MSIKVLAAAALITFAALPALAQTAPVAPPAPPSAPVPSAQDDDSEAAFEAKGEAFEARMDAMEQEMRAAVTAAGADTAKRDADLDAIVARYQPDADAFAGELSAFLTGMADGMPPEQRAEMMAAGPMIEARVKGAPAAVRAEVLEPSGEPADAPAR